MLTAWINLPHILQRTTIVHNNNKEEGGFIFTLLFYKKGEWKMLEIPGAPMGGQKILDLAGAKTIKRHVSQILNEKRDWKVVCKGKGDDAVTNYPEIGKQVVIRLYTKDMVFGEDKENIYVAEDIKVGTWDGENWTISDPQPKYDYSPLSNKNKLNDGVSVTHWAEPVTEPDEIMGWNTRLDKITDIDMRIITEESREEDVYRALLFGAFALTQICNTGMINESPERIRLYHQILCDLQGSIDFTSNEDMRDKEERLCGDGDSGSE